MVPLRKVRVRKARGAPRRYPTWGDQLYGMIDRANLAINLLYFLDQIMALTGELGALFLEGSGNSRWHFRIEYGTRTAVQLKLCAFSNLPKVHSLMGPTFSLLLSLTVVM